MGPVGEQKTKPTQHTVKELRGLGIIPDILVCRSENPLHDDTRSKLAAFCHVSEEAVVSAHDVSNIYRVPLMFDEQGVSSVLAERFGFKFGGRASPARRVDGDGRPGRQRRGGNPHRDGREVHRPVGLVPQVIKAFQHSSYAVNRKLVIDWIESAELDDESAVSDAEAHANAWEMLRAADGILVPGGFGKRGIEGKIKAAGYARENKVPYLGVCLGLQVATIEFCRNVLGMEGANSTEFDEDTPHPAVVFMPEISKTHMGGTMRLGTKPTPFSQWTTVR
ncbi:MAG: hypothetical protein CM1200mP32_04060 [Methanobacteriota archaeon]|nr:MAG: hypothetical protein CM1200mP32_04060 [Euryarchaeota archaeon]